jgi:hypothetical protein
MLERSRWQTCLDNHFFSLTPGPPSRFSFASRNTMPATSSALLTASTFAAVLADGPRALSILRTVGTDNFDICANFG